MERCPFCRIEIDEEATACWGCGATKGYIESNGRVYGKGQTVIFGVLLPIAGMIFLIVFCDSIGIIGLSFIQAILLGAGVLLAIPFCISVHHLVNGAVWYR